MRDSVVIDDRLQSYLTSQSGHFNFIEQKCLMILPNPSYSTLPAKNKKMSQYCNQQISKKTFCGILEVLPYEQVVFTIIRQNFFSTEQ